MRHLLKALRENFFPKVIVETFKAHNIPMTVHWVDGGTNFDNECWHHIKHNLKWDPETTLLFYTPRYETEPEADESLDTVTRLQISKKDNSILCLFIENKTPEELINLFLKTAKMKVFL